MKVGVDAVLIGSWAGKNPSKILEVGSGCGVISLMLAQRFPNVTIEAIDIDKASVDECNDNFVHSPWSDRLKVNQKTFPEDVVAMGRRYDLIVSNPPFFKSGIDNPVTPREKARHQNSLSMFSLIKYSQALLTDKGRLAMIFPVEFYDEVLKYAEEEGLCLNRECKVRNNIRRPVKRVMMEFALENAGFVEKQELVMFEDGVPSAAYLNLCRDFYLKF